MMWCERSSIEDWRKKKKKIIFVLLVLFIFMAKRLNMILWVDIVNEIQQRVRCRSSYYHLDQIIIIKSRCVLDILMVTRFFALFFAFIQCANFCQLGFIV